MVFHRPSGAFWGGIPSKESITMKKQLHHAASRAVRSLGRASGAKYLPTYLNSGWVWLPKEIWRGLYQVYESYMSGVVSKYVLPGDTVVDVGAHFGLWSVQAARRVGAGGRVVACEPSPAIGVLELVGKQYPQIEPRHVGLGAKDEVTEFFAQGISSSGSFVQDVTSINTKYYPGVEVTRESVQIMTLDSLLSDAEMQPALVKVDVEGYEQHVVAGATGLMGKVDKPIWVVELHHEQLVLSGGGRDEVLNMLVDHDYDIEPLFHAGGRGLETVMAFPRTGAFAARRTRQS